MEKPNTITAIIVDDEKGSIANLSHHLHKFCPDIQIIGTGQNLQEALDEAGTGRIDIAFLDVELSNTNIFTELADLGIPDYKIVFVTAYEKYAINAWKFNALDYLMKPLSEEDVKACYVKIKRHLQLVPSNQVLPADAPADDAPRTIILKQGDNIYAVRLTDIYYLSGNGFYTTITFNYQNEERSVMLSKPMNKIAAEYEGKTFFRVHKSYVINVDKIAKITRGDVLNIKMANDKVIPVAKRRVNEFLSFLNK